MTKFVNKFPEFDLPCCFGPPPAAGVYGVFSLNENYIETLHYIGSSKNIMKRVLSTSHHYRLVHNYNKNTYTRSILCDNYLEIEGVLIRKYRPEFNFRIPKL